MKMHVRDLDKWIDELDQKGAGFAHDPEDKNLDLVFDTHVNESLDPFSDEYFRHQKNLYEEIAGRKLDQLSGELYDISKLEIVDQPNPWGTKDIKFASKHVRAISAAIMMAKLQPESEVLDFGCGWGASSEILAFCGASVTSVDINPQFTNLIKSRAKKRNLSIQSFCSDFDNFTTNKKFDLIFFYESLHHSVKVWETLEHCYSLLKPSGTIVFAGEPINNLWKHWGVRLDPESVYAARKHGWFENGWSESFIASAFSRAGFTLELFPWTGLDNGYIGVAGKTAYPNPNLFEVDEASPANLFRVYQAK
jgi:2-polyprenyl-3-methyl-5-hydroxy-6-metoxy-1,4-benzoquinol methylase